MAIRVLIVEDSLTMRRRLCEAVTGDPELALIGEVGDGERAIEACRDLRPDVIAMDMVLPGVTGLAATEHIMAHHPTPILIVSASINRGDLFCTYDALAAGAVDVLDKPRGDEPVGEWDRQFVAALKLVSRIRVITHPRARLRPGRSPPPLSPPAVERPPVIGDAARCRIVAIGASTGGPGAVVDVLRGLPAQFQLPIVLVVHLSEPFSRALAEWLDGQQPRPVGYARDGEPVAAAAGRVVMAPSGHHLVVRGGRLRLTRDAERNWCRPSVDVLFESVAAEYGASAAGCLLTGMGRDGAAGLLAIRAAGGVTISQDEASCVVYGMPREAEALGASMRVLPLAEIGPALAALELPPGGSRGRL
ncbi:MAG TPA: chemotaxis-specific protein-glutamate methyltransferase CheB [Kofleriaceae bacterium]|nr:chemotaxis-specific protein-glutamate methyltransferase CheB [Kofleriaceae bacterium]